MEVNATAITPSALISFADGTTEDQSCNRLVGVDGAVSFLQFDRNAAADKVKLFSNITFDNGKNASTNASASNVTWSEVVNTTNMIKVGTKCEFISFNNEMYKLNGGNVTSTMADVTVPAGWSIQAYA